MPRKAMRIILFSLAGLACGVILIKIRGIFTPFFIAILIAYLIYPLVRSLEARGVGRVPAIMTVYAAGFILAVILIFLLIPALFQEASSFSRIVPVYSRAIGEIEDLLEHFSRRVQLPGSAQVVLLETIEQVRTAIIKAVRGFAHGLLGLISLIPSLILAPFLSYYIIKDFEHIKKRFLAILPPSCRNEMIYLLRETDLIFSKFLRGHLLISLTVGALTGLGAALIGMEFYILIGIFTAIFDLVPIIGPVIAAVPVVGLALAESRVKGVLMLVVYLVVQQLESSVLGPRLLGDQMGMHPLVIVFVLLIGGYLAGALGMILAVPVAGLLRVLWQFLWPRIV